ncbi:hypothetical protein IFM89_010263 [Coptis chinensis]|uniref:WD repeat-containing protein 75 second beta-propeller domain-containing protein n=1 Tax=Coptis chinensis TaxID=261450 RepID=A0A835HU25_9MAGN|nr:hypothetical protein IFM89_010263 [Coptis chinensis]
MITGGESLVSSPPAFSNDGKKLLVCTGNTVSIYSTSTTMLINELEGHKGDVTSVIVLPSGSNSTASKILCYCWTSSLDGTICYWDFSVAELIRKVDIRWPVFSMVIPNIIATPIESKGKPSDLFAFVSVKDASKPDVGSKSLLGQIWKCNLSKSSLVGGVLAETGYPEFITISASGEYFGIRNKHKVHLWKILAKDSKYDVKKMKLHHTKSFSVLAFHPKERILAAGDVTGRILIWRDFGNREFSGSGVTKKGRVLKNEEERPGVREGDDADSCTTWHWHPSEVKTLSFSSDGAYLYSGGKEGVLVVWQLETGKKKFLPRIGAPLLYFTESQDPSLSSVSCANNRIHLLKMPSTEIIKSISGIELPCSFPEIYGGLRGGVVFDHSAGLVVVQTESYSIQFYSLFDNREISQIQVCERSHQADDEVTLVLALTAVSMDGSKLSTAEVKLPEEGIGGLVCLKFWDSGSRKGEFILSTVIYEPHSDAGISALAFHPTRDMAVSSSFGGDFKVWVRSSSIRKKDQVPSKSGWRCHSVGSYKKRPMTAVAFSADGSVLAVAAETIITLWDADKNVLVAVIGEALAKIVSLSFVGKSEFIVSASLDSVTQLSVWSTSMLSMSWSYKLHAEAVACSKDRSCFAVLALIPNSCKRGGSNEEPVQDRDGVILLFNVDDPVPVSTWSVNKSKGGGICFLQSTPSSHDEEVSYEDQPPELLVYISGGHEYVVFDPYSKDDLKSSRNLKKGLVPSEETGKYGYTSIYGELPQFHIEKEQTQSVPFVPSERPWETIFSGSSHVLPPLTKLCSVFLESLLEKLPTIQD